MSSPAKQHLVLTALGSDRPGIVNTLTHHVSHCECNIEDSRLALLGEEFSLIMLLSGDSQAISLIESTLPIKGAELELLIVMKRTSTGDTPALDEGVILEVTVPDSPRIIERFTALLTQHQMNISELVTRTQPSPGRENMLYIQIKAYGIDPAHYGLFDQDFQNLCHLLQAEGQLRHYGSASLGQSEKFY